MLLRVHVSQSMPIPRKNTLKIFPSLSGAFRMCNISRCKSTRKTNVSVSSNLRRHPFYMTGSCFCISFIMVIPIYLRFDDYNLNLYFTLSENWISHFTFCYYFLYSSFYFLFISMVFSDPKD